MFNEYKDAFEHAQAQADLFGRDYGLEYNKLMRHYTVFGLPAERYRCGHETTCQVVRPLVCKPPAFTFQQWEAALNDRPWLQVEGFNAWYLQTTGEAWTTNPIYR